MIKKQRIVVSITFVDKDAEEIMKGYKELKAQGKTHPEIYLKGLRALRGKKE